MLLNDFLKKEALTQTSFSKLSGVPQSMLSKYIRRESAPSLLNVLKIHRATSGQVSLEDFFTDIPPIDHSEA